MKWNPVMKVWKKLELMLMRYEGKCCGFGVCIGLLPLILIVSLNEIQLWKFERNQSWCWWDMKENVRFWACIGLLPLILIVTHEMKPCYEGLKEIRVDVDEIWRKMLGFRVSIGLLPLILIISWNETLLWRFERNWSWCQWDMKENVGF